MLLEDVRLSVCRSVRHTPIFYRNSYKRIIRPFWSSRSHTILVFHTKNGMAILWRWPPASNAGGDLLLWLPIHQRIEFKLCLIVFKCTRNLAPKYLSDYCQPVSSNPWRRNLRSAARGDLVPPTRTTHCCPRGFAVAGPTAWNSLPASLHDEQLSVTSCRRLLKTHLFCRAYVGTPWARSWLFPVRVNEHKLLDLD